MTLTESSVKELSNDVIKSILTKKRMRDILLSKSYILTCFEMVPFFIIEMFACVQSDHSKK